MLSLLFLAAFAAQEGTSEVKVAIGDAAPAFSLAGSTGKTVTLAEFKGRKNVVLAFFPKSFSGACTKELAALRDHLPRFEKANTVVIGVSLDSVETQRRFADALQIPFPILSDRGGRVAKAYGVMGALWANRTTFVIDVSGNVAAVIEGKDAVDPAPTVAAAERAAAAK